MTYEPDDIAHVRLPLISLVLLVALPAALIPVLQFLSISLAGNDAGATANTANALSFASQPGSVIAGSIVGLLVAYVMGGRKTMFLSVLSIVVAVAAMLIIASPATFQWGRTTLNLGAGALLVLPILILGHYGSHRQIAAGMPGLILGPFVLVALIGLLTRPGVEDRIAALTNGAGGIEPMGWLAIALTVLLVLSLFRAMGRARGGRPNALFSAELRADARAALGFVLTGPQIYALLIAMALTGHAATTYLGDFARKSPLEGFGIGSTIAATLCLGFGGYLFARIFGPRRRQHVLATTIIFLLITTGLMAATDFMFAPTTGSLGVFVWPYTQDQLVLLVLTCAAMAMLGASFAMIWLSIVEVGLGVLATILLVTVLVARIAAPATVPLLPIPEMWLSTGLLGAALVLVALGTLFARNEAPPAPSEEFTFRDTAEQDERHDDDEHGEFDEPNLDPDRQFGTQPETEPVAEFESEPEPEFEPDIQEETTFDTEPAAQPVPPPATRAPEREAVAPEPVAEPVEQAPREDVRPDLPEDPPASGRSKGGLPWRRKRTKRDALARAVSSTRTEPAGRAEPRAQNEPSTSERSSDRPDPPRRDAGGTSEKAAAPRPDARHEAVQDTHIDWAKLGATVVDGAGAPQDEPAPTDTRPTEPENKPPVVDTPRAEDDVCADTPAERAEPVQPTPRQEPPVRSQPSEPSFTRHDSTIFDFDRLRDNTRGPDDTNDPSDEEKE